MFKIVAHATRSAYEPGPDPDFASPGPTGATGPTGPTGPVGPTGPTGATQEVCFTGCAFTGAGPNFSAPIGSIDNCLEFAPRYAHTIFVTPTGSDILGERERLDCPYATPWAAVADAVSGTPNLDPADPGFIPGDLIYVLPGTYDAGSASLRLVKDGVKMWCLPGVVINNIEEPFFDDGAPMRNSEIRGMATINMVGTTNRVLTNPLSNIVIEANEFTQEAPFLSTAGTEFFMTVKIITTETEALQFRLGNANIEYIKYHVNQLTALTAPNVIELTDVGALPPDNITAHIDVHIGELNVTQILDDDLSIVFLNNNTAHQKIFIDSVLQQDLGGAVPNANYVLRINNVGGTYDIKFSAIFGGGTGNIRIPYEGNSIVTTGTPIADLSTAGTIEMSGNWLLSDGPLSNDISNFDNANNVTLIFNADVAGINGVIRSFINATSSPAELFVTGRISYTGLDTSPLYNAIQLEANGGSAPTFRELVVTTTNSLGPFGTTTAGPLTVNMYNVFSNINLDANYTPIVITGGSQIEGFHFNPGVVA